MNLCTIRHAAGAAALALAVTAAHADVRLTFDAGTEGVTAFDGGSISHDAGGFLVMADTTGGDMRAVLPPALLAGAAGWLGGRLSFEAINLSGDSANWSPFGEVTLSGGGQTLTVDLAAPGQPGAGWTTYAADLTPAVWGPSLPAVLTALDGVTIKLEFHDGIVETAGLDNVSITAVPEPGAGWLLLAGLLALAGAARRKPAAPRV